MKLHLTQDPENGRIGAQTRPFEDWDFPIGLEGQDWPIREAEVDEAVWDDMLCGRIAPTDQDRLHLEWWAQNEPLDEDVHFEPVEG